MPTYDLVIVGGGPGGYPAAIAGAKAGLRIALVEDRGLGGECVLYGCVPSKALLAGFLALRQVLVAGGSATLSLDSALEHARRVAREASGGLEGIMERLGVSVYHGRGHLTPQGSVEVGGEVLEARLGVLYAPGSAPLVPRGWEVDGRRVLDNRSFFSQGLPEGAGSVAIVGGGYVGVELAQVLALAGLEVYLFEAEERLLPGMDRDLSLTARRLLSRLGVRVYTGSPVASLRVEDGRVRLSSSGASATVDSAIVAVGRRPVVEEAVRAGALLTDSGYVAVNSCGRSSVPWLYIAGDAAGPPLLAHKAIHESLTALQCISGGEPSGLGPVPQVVFGVVDLVSVGETLEEARIRDPEAYEVRIPTGGFSSQRMRGVQEGFAKIVVSRGRVVGFHAAFPGAGEVVGEASLIVSLMLGLEDIAGSIHPHPTMSEAIWETVMEALGSSVHVLRGRRR